MGRKILFLIILTFLFFISACENRETSNPVSEPITIGVSVSSMKQEVFHFMKEAMEDSKERDNVQLIWLSAENEQEKERENINKLIKKKVDIIIFNPLAVTESSELVEKINEAKIPVLAIDRFIPEANLDGYLTANNIELGIEQAKYLVDQLGQRGKIMILKGDKENNVAYDITTGNKSILKNYINIRIVSEKWHKKWSTELAEETVRQTLERHPDLKGILANNSDMAMAALKVLKEKKLTDKIVTIGADANKEASIAIAKGEHNADFDKMPYLLGLATFKAAQMIARKESWHFEMRMESGDYKIPVKVTPIKLITENNIITMSDRYPEINKYLK